MSTTPSVAVILGSSTGIGLHLSRFYLASTSLNVVSLSRQSSKARSSILDSTRSSPLASISHDHSKLNKTDASKLHALDESRLTTLDVDCSEEESIAKAAEQVEKKFGKNSVRLLFNVAGVLHPEKSLSQVDYDKMLQTFKINTFAPLLSFKHFAPLLPKKIDYSQEEDSCPARGFLPKDMAVVASLSARVGSIGDNGRGGWYSYRASKAAQNQLTKTLSHELRLRNHPAISVGLHPGTVRTDLSREFTGGPESNKEKKQGEFDADEAASNLAHVIKGLKAENSGGFFDWQGKEIPW